MAHGLTIYDSPADALTSGQWPKVGPAVRQRGVATSRGRSIQSLLSRVSDRNLGRLGIQVQSDPLILTATSATVQPENRPLKVQ
jgi:hypothetical protein